eukprot:1800147-Pleurochrysis_carterae.AAC.3
MPLDSKAGVVHAAECNVLLSTWRLKTRETCTWYEKRVLALDVRSQGQSKEVARNQGQPGERARLPRWLVSRTRAHSVAGACGHGQAPSNRLIVHLHHKERLRSNRLSRWAWERGAQ